jgi:L-fucose isomerase-like protein
MGSRLAQLRPRIGVASLSSPLEVGADRAPQAAEGLAKLVEDLGCDVVKAGAIDTPERSIHAGRALGAAHVHAVAFVSTSWYEDYLVLDLLEECGVPVLLWALSGMETGALCGNQQLTAYLKQLGVAYECVFGTLDDAACVARARTFLRGASLAHALRRARIGMGGHRVAGMTEVAVNEIALKKAIGPRVVPLDMPQLLKRAAEAGNEDASKLWQSVVKRSASCKVSDADGLDSMRVYAAVRELVERDGLDALTIGCYPHLMGRVCLAASLLADEGVPFACEGDVNGAVGQLMLALLTGEPTHHTDWLEPLEDQTIVLTHCGSGSFSLAEKPDEITLAPVRLMNQGVCALFPSRTGPVTLLNLMPVGDGYQVALLEGEAVSTEMVFPGNPLRVRLEHPMPDVLDWIHTEGIGHHWAAGYGHVGAEVRAWARIAGSSIRLVEPLT